MRNQGVRMVIDVPATLHRRLERQAAARGQSVRELILAGVKDILLRAHRPRGKRVQFPLIVSKGPKVDLTNEQICGDTFP